MTVGGNDTIFKVRPTPELREFVRRYIAGVWPNVVQETVPDADEMFFYKDEKAQQSWDDWGCIDENDDTMVHVLYGKDSFTMVVASSGLKTPAMAAELRTNLQVNFHRFECTE